MSTLDADWSNDQPIYRQLKQRLIGMILDGLVPEGEAMPSVRTIALELKINPLTVSKAMQELEDEGAIEKRRGLGMFVKAGAVEGVRAQERGRFLSSEWPGIEARLRRLNISVSDLFTGARS